MISRELLQALLSLDSYNRGYDRNVNTPGQILGDITIISDSSILEDEFGLRRDVLAGFYAVAYNVSALGIADLGNTVVSYRGTQFVTDATRSEFEENAVLSDALGGWSVGAGLFGTQGQLAIEFYREVVGTDNSPFDTNVSVTGHSLGGGLAGLVGSLYGLSGDLFDNMTFETTAATVRLASLISSDLSD